MQNLKIKLGLVLGAAAAIAIPAVIAFANPQGEGKGDDFEARRAERHAAMLEKYDTNHDGQLSPEERAVMRHDFAVKRFAEMDTNHDGNLTLAEFEAGMPMHMRHHGAPPPDEKK